MTGPRAAAAAVVALSLGGALSGCALPGPAVPDAGPPDTLGIRFVAIPAGEFMMGSEESPEALARAWPNLERERFGSLGDEAPAHRVRITRPFELGRFEVTVGQFRRFIERSGHVPESVADGTGGYGWRPDHDPSRSPRGDAFDGRDPRWSWADPGFAQGDDHPVVNVTWHDARAMAAWLSRVEGRRYRLPTEAEWEYACRAGQRTRYQHGDDPEGLVRSANVFDADAAPWWPRWRQQALDGHDGHAFTAPVGRHAPNAWGVHDLHGNVWEWTADGYAEDTYARSPLDDPAGPVQADAQGTRVRRGGSWHTWSFYARCSYRNYNTPSSRYVLLGFRLARDARP